MLGGDSLDCEGDVMREDFGGKVENPDAGFGRREGESPEGEPGADVVEDDLYVPQFGLASSGGATGD